MKTLDKGMQRVTALPAAGATAESASVDLGANRTGAPIPALDVTVEIAAVPNLVEAKTIVINVQDSADDAAFANVETLGNMIVTGAVGDGAAAKTFRFQLPPHVRQFLRVQADIADAGAGDNTNENFTLNFRV